MFSKILAALPLVAAVALLGACSDGSDSARYRLPGCADSGSCQPNPPLVIGGERPSMVALPADYDVTRRYPLVMVLHGRGVNGLVQSLYMDLLDGVDRRDYILVYPDGLVAGDGRRQWRSTPTCCDTPAAEADAISDVGYLSGLIEEAAATYSVDTSRVGLIGHSSGGFMALTMACEASHLVTSLVQLAGSTFVDLELCQPASERVSVLSIHGDQDDTVFFDGIEGRYLSAPAVAQRYAMLAGCDTANPQAQADVDLVASIDGAETSVTSWPGCLRGSAVEFWKMNGGPHIPAPWVPAGLDQFVGWILQHPRD
ncbi:MAG: hypothetical protein CME59_13945 [Halioglobus sp.]|nr:hypothetical protein [Halioglobus sp.]